MPQRGTHHYESPCHPHIGEHCADKQEKDGHKKGAFKRLLFVEHESSMKKAPLRGLLCLDTDFEL